MAPPTKHAPYPWLTIWLTLPSAHYHLHRIMRLNAHSFFGVCRALCDGRWSDQNSNYSSAYHATSLCTYARRPRQFVGWDISLQVLSPILIIYHTVRGHAATSVVQPAPNGAPNLTVNNAGQKTSSRNSIQLTRFGPGRTSHSQPAQSFNIDIEVESINSHFNYDDRPDSVDLVKRPVL